MRVEMFLFGTFIVSLVSSMHTMFMPCAALNMTLIGIVIIVSKVTPRPRLFFWITTAKH
jgi:hypothetical protein